MTCSTAATIATAHPLPDRRRPQMLRPSDRRDRAAHGVRDLSAAARPRRRPPDRAAAPATAPRSASPTTSAASRIATSPASPFLDCWPHNHKEHRHDRHAFHPHRPQPHGTAVAAGAGTCSTSSPAMPPSSRCSRKRRSCSNSSCSSSTPRCSSAATSTQRYKQLARLKLSLIHGCRTCNKQNVPGALEAGFTQAQIDALSDGNAEPFAPAERAVIDYAEQIALSNMDGRMTPASVREPARAASRKPRSWSSAPRWP